MITTLNHNDGCKTVPLVFWEHEQGKVCQSMCHFKVVDQGWVNTTPLSIIYYNFGVSSQTPSEGSKAPCCPCISSCHIFCFHVLSFLFYTALSVWVSMKWLWGDNESAFERCTCWYCRSWSFHCIISNFLV